MSFVCFADEGGSLEPCSRMCVAHLCFAQRGSIHPTPHVVYEWVRRLLGWRRGELKWRSVKKASRRRDVSIGEVIGPILEESLCYSLREAHIGSYSEIWVAKERLFLQSVEDLAGCECSASALVADAHLAGERLVRSAARMLGASYARIGDSRVYIGIQLADLVASACSERLLGVGASCLS